MIKKEYTHQCEELLNTVKSLGSNGYFIFIHADKVWKMIDIHFKLCFCDQEDDISEMYLFTLGKLENMEIFVHAN